MEYIRCTGALLYISETKAFFWVKKKQLLLQVIWFNLNIFYCLNNDKRISHKCFSTKYCLLHIYTIYTVRQKLSTTWLVSIISFLIMNLFQIGLLFSLPVHTYLLTCETGYWSIFIYVYKTGCVKCHVYFSTFVFANESWFFFL